MLADELVAHNIGLIYGGSSTGLMGAIADRTLTGGGHVAGVIPRGILASEVTHTGLTELHIVDSMNARKEAMMEQADGFIALPGGFGTLDELFETLTNAQLHLHKKPVGLLNTNGYYDALLTFLDHAEKQGLLASANRRLLTAAETPQKLLNQLCKASRLLETA